MGNPTFLGANGGGNPIFLGQLEGVNELRLILTTAQIKAAHSSPIALPIVIGAGKVVILDNATFSYVFSGSAFDKSTTPQFTGGIYGAGTKTFEVPIHTEKNTNQLASCASNGGYSGDTSSMDGLALSFLLADTLAATGGVATKSIGAGGTNYLVGDTGTIHDNTGAGNGTAVYQVSAATNSFAITALNQGAKTFKVAGDHAAAFTALDSITVFGSTGNDGSYTVASAAFAAGVTSIVVAEAIPSAVADGGLGDATTGAIGVVTGITITATGHSYLAANGAVTATVAGVGSGLTVNVLTVTDLTASTGVLNVTYSIFSI